MPSHAPRHAARRRDGDIAPYRYGTRGGGTATGHGGASREGGEPPRAMRAGCQAATGGGAAAKHRALRQRGTKGGVAGEGIGAVRTAGYGVFAG